MRALAMAAALVVAAPAKPAVLHGATDLARLIDSSKTTPLVLHFWASWCPGCVKELPAIAPTLEAAKMRGARVVLVSLDDPKDWPKAAALLDDDKVPGERVLLDAPDVDPIAALLHPGWDGGLPATFVFRGGTKKAEFLGPVRPPQALLRSLGR